MSKLIETAISLMIIVALVIAAWRDQRGMLLGM